MCGPSEHELDIPAVIGATAALTDVPDGALVELDLIEGLVTVVAPDPHLR